MRKFPWFSLAAVATLFSLFPVSTWPALHAQKPPFAPTPAAAPQTLEDRRKALSDLFHDYWEDRLKRDPEYASEIGDKRYNDQIADYSVRAVNERLAEEQKLLLRLAAIDPTGFTDDEKTSQELLMRRFELDEEGAEFKEWEMPVNQMAGIYYTYPRLAAQLSFTTVKDYDDWIARLHAIPRAFSQVTENMSIGMDDGRVPPKYLLEKALEQVKQLAGQKPEDSPLALPLKKFPAAISASEQERIKTEMLDAIGKEVLPAYLRFARFLEVSYVPAGRAEPGIGALPDGAKYYQFLIKRTTTTDLTPEQIHQIGLDEVEKDEAADAGHCAEAGLQGSGQLPRQPEDQSQAAPGLGRCAAGCLSRLSDAHAGQAAGALWPPAQGAVRSGRGARLH